MRRAVFLDRDGTINREVHFLSRPDDLELLPGAAGAIASLNRAGLAVVCLSNQSGLARGYFTWDDLAAIEAKMNAMLAAQGAAIEEYYYCPHHPGGVVPELSVTCSCRKPATGLVERAASELGLLLPGSFMVGDRLRDVACGKRAGMSSILVESGHRDWPPASPEEEPDLVAPDLAAAARWILGRLGEQGR